VYLESELLTLCEAYGNPLSARATKEVLAKALFEVIANNPRTLHSDIRRQDFQGGRQV